MAKRRNAEVKLCFDSMTDLITNLAGGLLLLVLLLLGVTGDASSQTRPPPGAADQTGKAAAEKSPRPLEERVRRLDQAVQQVEEQIKTLEGQLPALRQEVEALLGKVAAFRPPEVPEPPPEKKEPTRVEFRPPLERLVTGRESVLFLLEDQRLRHVDLKPILEEVNKQMRTNLQGPNPAKLKTIPIAFDLPDCRVEGEARLARAQLRLRFKPGAPGETLEELRRPDSRYQALLKQFDPKRYVIAFLVYPDSFDTFREARKLAWQAEYELGWNPLKPGGPALSLGRGGGVNIVN